MQHAILKHRNRANKSMEPTGASRSVYFRIGSQRWLAPAVHAQRWSVPL